jgi:tetratricopeptide (TPR) repeat protein
VATGVAGMLSYLLIFFSVFYVLWKKFAKGEIGFWAASIFSAMLMAYFFQNLTVFDMVNSYMLFFLVLAFVANVSSDRKYYECAKEGSLNVSLLIIVIALFSFFFTFFIINPLKTGKYAVSALAFPVGSSYRLEFYEKALKTSSVGKYQIRDYFAQSDMEIIQSSSFNNNDSLKSLKKELDFVIGELEKSVKESLLDYRSFLKLGQLYSIKALVDNDFNYLLKSEETLKKSIELSPSNQQGYWALAQTEIYLSNFNEALSLAEKALILEPKSKQANIIAIEVAKIMGDEELVKEKIKEAIKTNPLWEKDFEGILED